MYSKMCGFIKFDEAISPLLNLYQPLFSASFQKISLVLPVVYKEISQWDLDTRMWLQIVCEKRTCNCTITMRQ